MPPLLEKRVIFVTGKGGVGKSTVAAALGVAAARKGKRAIICEVAQQERMSRFFERQGVGYHETEIAPNLFAFSIDPQRALEEYLLMQIKVKPVYDLMFKNRVFTYFAAATPGLRELVTVGKVWELAQLDRRVKRGSKYDVVIVDAPATGHGVSILKTPKTDRKSTRLNSSHLVISYAVFCLKKKKPSESHPYRLHVASAACTHTAHHRLCFSNSLDHNTRDS